MNRADLDNTFKLRAQAINEIRDQNARPNTNQSTLKPSPCFEITTGRDSQPPCLDSMINTTHWNHGDVLVCSILWERPLTIG